METAGGLPSGFWYLWTGTLINRIGSFVLILLSVYLTHERGFTPTFAGLVIGLWGAGGALGTLVGGVLADRWGRKPTYLTFLYSSSALMLALGFAHSALLVAVTVFLLGMAAEGSRPAMSALMIDIVGPHERLRAFSLNYWVINLGFAFSAIAAGALANVDYLLIFIVDAVSTAAAATVVAIKVRDTHRGTRGQRTPRPAAGGSLLSVFADRVFLGFFACNLLLALVFMQHISTLPLAMTGDGLSTGTYGLVIAINGILIVAGQLFVPRLLRHVPRAHALALGAVLVGVGFALTAFAGAAWFYAISVVIWTLGEMADAPSKSALLADLSPSWMRGRYQGASSLAWSMASFGAPIIGAAVQQHLGNATLWLGCLVVSLLVAAGHLLMGPARERRAVELRAAELAAAASSSANPRLVPAA
ncbi:MFS transporter [Luedemannella helvata]|uniref:MFS transporter n=1 Tax=Luedemannella helvata TaxID=349315 RepID=A0ABP4XB86_9ACTN